MVGIPTASGCRMPVERDAAGDGSRAETTPASPDRMHAAGFAEFRPEATNETEAGREKNRRVELYFYARKNDNKDALQKSVLDKAEALNQ